MKKTYFKAVSVNFILKLKYLKLYYVKCNCVLAVNSDTECICVSTLYGYRCGYFIHTHTHTDVKTDFILFCNGF